MIRTLLLATAGAAALFLTGCGGDDRSNHEERVEQRAYPAWVADPFSEGQFGAVGISRDSLIGAEGTMQRALADGRAKLADSIKAKVQRAYVRFFTEGGESSRAADGSIQRDELAQEMSENVTRTLTNQVISGSRQKDIWRDGEGLVGEPGTLFMWVVIDRSQMDLLSEQIRAEASNEVARRAQVRAELKARDALDRLDALIDDELQRQEGIPADSSAAPAAAN